MIIEGSKNFGAVTHIGRLKILKKLDDSKDSLTMSTTQNPYLRPSVYKTVIWWEGRMR